VLGVGGWYGWGYTQSRYYVGATNDGHIAVFQGVQGKIIGFKLNHVSTGSDLTLTDLNSDTQSRVKQGIPQHNKVEAEKTLTDLSNPANGFLRQTCPAVINPNPSLTPSGAPAPSATPTAPLSSAGKTTASVGTKRPSAKAGKTPTKSPSPQPPTVAPSNTASALAGPASDSSGAAIPNPSATSDNC
jgi:PPM family protein phosphatase